MPRFPVTPQKQQELVERMAACGLNEQDLEEQFVTARGPGGQKTNHTATAVRLRHLPTGLEVKWGTERSQGLNRFFARRRLCELLEAARLGHQAPAERKAEKIRRQKKRRARRSSLKQPGKGAGAGGEEVTPVERVPGHKENQS
ncbi:MAG TPA: peptide chain release factor-like protein [Candidatus Hydrogenedentes bacterium]|nr:peptide chain release factor-like protein [Candidatus Hydrogenedentota bacterium]HOK88983.1 peptide chain release factor-like protein [Candidatus Hydrogenedentota bacterium]HOV60103.1 peptide chain release factor-like protein [Candidatus Hydrogenedentota bacterium]HPO31466.1 peptide chain release factor-like protein [Candidatus Hydrogenedentota bacterium]